MSAGPVVCCLWILLFVGWSVTIINTMIVDEYVAVSKRFIVENVSSYNIAIVGNNLKYIDIARPRSVM